MEYPEGKSPNALRNHFKADFKLVKVAYKEAAKGPSNWIIIRWMLKVLVQNTFVITFSDFIF